MMMNTFNLLFLFLCFALFCYRRSLRYLHIFQQDEYDARRFLAWFINTGAFDKRLSLTLAVLMILFGRLGTESFQQSAPLFFAVVFALFAAAEVDPRKVAKKKLVLTMRAKRIFVIAMGLSLVTAVFLFRTHLLIRLILSVQIIPLSLVGANFVLMPFELAIQRKIAREASRRLRDFRPTVIGITGSFGKTSVKHILGHILEMHAPTLYTPGSVNTLMGIARIIREKLNARIQYFIVEMGAYGRGSIARLCGLTPPQWAIITALGDAHYERFKSLDAVAHAKFELAEAVLKEGEGRIIIHDTVLMQDYARKFVSTHRTRFTLCGISEEVDYRVLSAEQTHSGLALTIKAPEGTYAVTAPLFGLQHAGNIVLAFAAAASLGIVGDRISASLRTVPQIKHRLEVKPQANGTIYIDDGFNSNQKGFEAALDLLNVFGSTSHKRRILITPGIVELGDKHDDVHRTLGEKAASCVDIALVVQANRIPTFVASFKAKAPMATVHLVTSLAEAQSWLATHGLPGDIILIENDLPDLGESTLKL